MTINFELLKALWKSLLVLMGRRRVCQHRWIQHSPTQWKCKKCPEVKDAF